MANAFIARHLVPVSRTRRSDAQVAEADLLRLGSLAENFPKRWHKCAPVAIERCGGASLRGILRVLFVRLRAGDLRRSQRFYLVFLADFAGRDFCFSLLKSTM